MTDKNKTDMPTDREPSQRDNTPDDDGSFFNKVRSDTLKKKIEAMLKKDGVIKSLVSELKMPREIVTHLMSQIDETKQAALGVISKEVRLFFEHTNLSEEMANLLSQVSFEVSTRIRFVKNDQENRPTKKKNTVSQTQPASAPEEAQSRQDDISETTE